MSGNVPHPDAYSFSPGQSVVTEDVAGGGGLSESGSATITNNHGNDEELSISENTISSDKPINIRNNNRKKVKLVQNFWILNIC